MKDETALRDALTSIQLDNQLCPSKAHVNGLVCLDAGHAIRGTWLAVLRWVLDLGDAPWQK